jgi:membrane associated rhomboid family serine protease
LLAGNLFFSIFLNRIGGNLFTALCAYHKISVGASTSIFGFISTIVIKLLLMMIIVGDCCCKLESA